MMFHGLCAEPKKTKNAARYSYLTHYPSCLALSLDRCGGENDWFLASF